MSEVVKLQQGEGESSMSSVGGCRNVESIGVLRVSCHPHRPLILSFSCSSLSLGFPFIQLSVSGLSSLTLPTPIYICQVGGHKLTFPWYPCVKCDVRQGHDAVLQHSKGHAPLPLSRNKRTFACIPQLKYNNEAGLDQRNFRLGT